MAVSVEERLDEQARTVLVDEIIRQQRTLFRAMHARAKPAWLELDLTMTQLKVMFILRDESLSIGSLAELLGVGLSAASQLIERLVQQGIVERREDVADRRRSLVQLSARGRAIDTRLREGGAEQMRAWMARLDDTDLAALAQGLAALATTAGDHELPTM